MKKLYIILIAFVYALGMVSCSQNDAERTIYNPASAAKEVSFRDAAEAFVFPFTQQEDGYTVYLVRGNADTEFTIDVELDDQGAGLFTGASSVTFPKGEYLVPYTIGFNSNDLETGLNYVIYIDLPEGYEVTNEERNMGTEVLVLKDYIWEEYKPAIVNDIMLYEDELFFVEKATTANVYRIEAYFKKYYDLRFWFDSTTGEVTMFGDLFAGALFTTKYKIQGFPLYMYSESVYSEYVPAEDILYIDSQWLIDVEGTLYGYSDPYEITVDFAAGAEAIGD